MSAVMKAVSAALPWPRSARCLQIQSVQHTTSTAVEISRSDHHTTIVVVRDSNGDNDCGLPAAGSMIIARGYPAGFRPNGGFR